MIKTEKREFENVSNRLKYLRIKKGITRREVARIANIDHTRYGAMEREGVSLQIRTLVSIVNKVYKMTLVKFFAIKLPKKKRS
ncbi:MAG: helix-turn-helix domain-containing protein [Candidatus Lindowbacteria bacterium]|nr:helix-turn-helix domain-containing protein [Candidatus Lindowbacteria bacterium]